MRYDSLARKEERICAKVIEMECHPSDPFLFFSFLFPFPIYFFPTLLVSKRNHTSWKVFQLPFKFRFSSHPFFQKYLQSDQVSIDLAIEKNYIFVVKRRCHSSFDQNFRKISPPHKILKIAETCSIDFVSRHVDRRQADQASNYLWQRRIREARRDKGRRWQQTFHSLLTFPALESLGIRDSNTCTVANSTESKGIDLVKCIRIWKILTQLGFVQRFRRRGDKNWIK